LFGIDAVVGIEIRSMRDKRRRNSYNERWEKEEYGRIKKLKKK
jgi:hypothetical protein